MSTIKQSKQFWLVELDQYDNPNLIDGAHSDFDGANKALYLRKRLGMKRDVRYAVAEIILHETTEKSYKVNEEAIRSINEMH